MTGLEYTITKVGTDNCSRFHTKTSDVGCWNVAVGESLEQFRVFVGGEEIGLIWGSILDPQEVISSDETISIDPDQSIPNAFEETLYRLAGRYVGLLASGDYDRLYMDPGGFLPVVYRTGQVREIASSPAMLSIDYDEQFREDLYNRFETDNGVWLPGRQTYHNGVRRLLPNHYLNLESWESRRHWPCEGDLSDGHDLETAADTILSNTNEIIDHAIGKYDTLYSSLTAGRDSRLLLAASHKHSLNGDVNYFTFGSDDRLDEDLYAAKIIANDVEIHWESIPRRYASESEQDQWLRKTGHSVGSGIMEIHPTLASISGDARLVGLGGEIGRGYYWEKGDDLDTTLTPRNTLNRMNRPKEPELIEEVSEWLDEVSEEDTYTTLDLLYQEFRLGCWAGPQQLGSAPVIDLIGPLCYRSTIKAMHMIPPEMRGEDSAVPHMIEQQWPELTKLSFNEFEDYRKYESLARKAINNPKEAMRRVMSLFV